jgi:hypothetical protein
MTLMPGFVGGIRERGAVGDAVLKRLCLWRAARRR